MGHAEEAKYLLAKAKKGDPHSAAMASVEASLAVVDAVEALQQEVAQLAKQAKQAR